MSDETKKADPTPQELLSMLQELNKAPRPDLTLMRDLFERMPGVDVSQMQRFRKLERDMKTLVEIRDRMGRRAEKMAKATERHQEDLATITQLQNDVAPEIQHFLRLLSMLALPDAAPPMA